MTAGAIPAASTRELSTLCADLRLVDIDCSLFEAFLGLLSR